ncbi:hypothetical protein ACFLU6_03545 [Acidobacteriota bacterium]
MATFKEIEQKDREVKEIGIEGMDPGQTERVVIAEGHLEIGVKLPLGRTEILEKDRRRVELVGGKISGGRIVITNLWTKVVTVLPADAVVMIYS